MCGIVGYVGTKNCTPILLDGLRRLEYRGYDSAGVAIHDGTRLNIIRSVGKLSELDRALEGKTPQGSLGIGHTRWATHGKPNEVNAHPHYVDGIAVVHNGIIENHATLRKALIAAGRKMTSDTDTELMAHLIAQKCAKGLGLFVAVQESLKELHGAFAIAVVSDKEPGTIIVAKQNAPLVIGLGDGENYCASDVPALLQLTRKMLFLEDGEMAEIRKDGYTLLDHNLKAVKREPTHIDWTPAMAEKDGFKHFMLKEIYEQPRALEDTLRGRIDRERECVVGEEIGLSDVELKGIERVILLACGTSYHASMLGQRWIEHFASIPAQTELASEFRARQPVVGPKDLIIAVSQSGETLDTLAAVKHAKERGASVLAIANVIGSAIPRLSNAAFYTHAGPEIGVASTKCFSTQMAALLLFALHLGRVRDRLQASKLSEILAAVEHLPSQIRETLEQCEDTVQKLAREFVEARDVLFLGRGTSFPIALEGALKLKEISYIHAEGYAAGEMKHGPIALIDKHLPVFILMPQDETFEKTSNNLAEVRARDGIAVTLTDKQDAIEGLQNQHVIRLPSTHPELFAFLSVLPLQLFSYYMAELKGHDVDQPRNLAKTVTVE